jgi:hypothetical protein
MPGDPGAHGFDHDRVDGDVLSIRHASSRATPCDGPTASHNERSTLSMSRDSSSTTSKAMTA